MTYAATLAIQQLAESKIEADKQVVSLIREARRRVRYALDGDQEDASPIRSESK